MAGANTLTFDDANFEREVLQSSTPVLVDFWAEWCGPCQVLAPTIDEIANDYHGRIKVGKVDVDQAQQTAMKYNVQSIPTVILFQNGEPVEKLIGTKPKREYARVLDAKVGAAG